MDAPTLTIEVANQQTLPVNETALISAARLILVEHEVACGELSIAVVDDPTMRTLNKQYLDHDYETDVISFVLDEDEATRKLDGQLIVSADTAAREAVEAGWSADTELLLYVVHGTLHLVGYDDKSPEAEPDMRVAEADYLKRLLDESPARQPSTHPSQSIQEPRP